MYTIRLNGITPKPRKEDQFMENFNKFILSDITEAKIAEKIVYERVPIKFTGIQHWPKKLVTKCRYCSGMIPGVPHPILDKDIATVRVAAFCGPICVNGHLATYPDSVRHDLKRQYIEFYYQLTNRMITYIPTADDISYLEEYGGTWTRSQYIDSMKKKEDLIT